MKHKYIVVLFALSLFYCSLFCETIVNTYFAQTDHEINVYHIKGKEAGATLVIVGAIQGDETAPFLAADYFVDIALKKGNLILIPRANLPTIFTNRRLINQDMNRRFSTTSSTHGIYEDAVVDVLKRYIMQGDIFLNLHEGGGFYRHTWEGPDHNPMKYGQCLIADADSFYVERTGETISLKTIAETVIEKINEQIVIEEHTYRFNNHNTISDASSHLEQRGSASYFGLTQANIPSYGVEVARQVPSETQKKEYIKIVIKEFMNYLDIQIDTPPIYEPQPELNYLRVTIDGEKRYIEPNDVLNINENARLTVTGISTNYPRGNYVDVVGYGNKNDINKTFTINRNTEILVNKDSQTIHRIPVRVRRDEALAFEGFRVNIIDTNTAVNVFAGDTLAVTEATEIEIVGPINQNQNISIRVAGATPRNVGSRQIIDTGAALSERFAINRTRDLYEIVVAERNNHIATSYLKINPIQAFGLTITHNDKQIVMAPGDTLNAKYGDILFIHDVALNGISSQKVKVNFAGYVVDPRKDAEDRGANIHLTRQRLLTQYAVNSARNIYEIHILYKQKRYATYTVKLSD